MSGGRSQSNIGVPLVMLGAVSVLLIWWEWKQGAYFGPVFYPGAIIAFSLLAVLLFSSPVQPRIAGPARSALLSLAALGAWTLLSLLWTNVPAAPIAYAERIFAYAALFTIGLWATSMLGPRMHMALLPIALAGVVVGAATVVVLATGTDVTWYLQGDATLRFPVGYRNADAALFLICLWPLLGLVANDRWRWPLRALALSAATLLVSLAILCQSRGSLPALVAAACVFLALSPRRLKAGLVIVLATLPALPFLSELLAVFRYNAPDPGVIPLLRDAARACGYSAGISLMLGALAFGLVQPKLHLGPNRVRVTSWIAGILAVIVAIGGSAAFLARHGGPVAFIDQRASEFGRVGYPNLHGQGVRFGANVGSNRHDFWRVAVDEGLEAPLLGGGAGSFQLVYQRHRQSPEEPHDPHSILADVFSELGFPGLIMLLAFVACSGWAVLRSRRAGTLAAALAAAAAAGAVQWFVQGSWDWFWQYAGVSALGTYLLGVAAAPGQEGKRGSLTVRTRAISIATLTALALVAVPLFVSDRYISRADSDAGSNPMAAIAALGKAADLNPLSDEPLIARGAIQAELGQRKAAVNSFRQASNREPEDFAPYVLIARQLLDVNRPAALTALRRAAELNPRYPEVAALRRDVLRH